MSTKLKSADEMTLSEIDALIARINRYPDNLTSALILQLDSLHRSRKAIMDYRGIEEDMSVKTRTRLHETLRAVLTERSDHDIADHDQREVVLDDLVMALERDFTIKSQS